MIVNTEVFFVVVVFLTVVSVYINDADIFKLWKRIVVMFVFLLLHVPLPPFVWLLYNLLFRQGQTA